MADNYGPGVSRVLVPQGTQYLQVIWQEGKPPCDAELNLTQQLENDWRRVLQVRNTPSGWLANETSTRADYQTNVNWSNFFRFGRQRTGETQSIMWAAVNGWLIPVTGTRTGTPPGSPNDSDTTNIIALDPPPASSGDFRTDFAFLEVWLARLPPNPSTQNKPASSAVWRYGNVEGGYSFLPDDLVDPALGFETTERVQVQYRVRIVKGITSLPTNPDGFDATIKAQGTQAAPPPVGGFTFTNMRLALGDPGLWRAGDGTANSLGTVDGFVYAIPLCAVFRRNAAVWAGDPSPNLNGGINRNPTAVDRTGIKTFTTVPTLAAPLTASAVFLTLVSTTGLPLPLAPVAPVFIKVGDELMTYQAINTLTGQVTGLIRGVNGTVAETHPIGATISIVSGRPDGLFSDQIALTDVLDLRHAVNPNGFDYNALLASNLDKLLRGQLRANWKRTNGSTQGVFVGYQDKIGAVGGPVALGVTKIDGPDNIREIYSDAAVMQPVELVVKANGLALPADISNTGFSLAVQVNHTVRAVAGQFNPGDVMVVPVAEFKTGLQAGDADQVRLVNDGLPTAVIVRVDGSSTPLLSSAYTVTPANPGPSDDLTITLNGSFPVALTKQLYITIAVLYGPGRGISRRPDSMHTIAFTSPSNELMLQESSTPFGNVPLRIGWAPLWSRFRSATYKNVLPVTAEAYGDLGSKTVVITPFRRITWPTEFRTIDGTSINVAPVSFVTGAAGSSTGTPTLTDGTKNFTALGVIPGDVVIITAPVGAVGTYVVATVAVTTLTVTTPIPVAVGINYTISHAQGVMPTLKADGVTPKWTTTDPLQLFSASTDVTSTGFAATKNIFVTLPRHLVPGWGEIHVPILRQDTPSTNFAEGINFMLISKKGGAFTDGDKNYVPYNNSPLTYAPFSTFNWNLPGPSTYNTAFTFSGDTFAGIRFFTDTRGLGRTGLELPPFYGISRLFAVYEATDYQTNGSAYNASTRQPTGGGAKNLLRQDFQGPTFWIEIDADGDSTFILNSAVLDLSKSPTPIPSFAAGNYVIEASVFGFDRGAFDLTKQFRMVLTRPTNPATMRSQAADTVTRANNLGVAITGPTGVLPGPATASDQIVINYSRTPYQGDAWGTQTNYVDTPYVEGPMATGTAYQIVSTRLNQAALTRPNQKVLEVLATLGFQTTLGTGRLSGDLPSNLQSIDFRSVGYEDPAAFPPATPISPRPKTLVEAFGNNDHNEANPTYLGLTDRLPLGSLLRDKDFRGGDLALTSTSAAALSFYNSAGFSGNLSAPIANPLLEVSEAILSGADLALGTAGNIIVQVDGEPSNYALLVNYRTARGGSAFSATGDHPGGEVGSIYGVLSAPNGHTNVLTGRAYLVRNTVTTSGANEVSAGDELMMLILTSAQNLKNTSTNLSFAAISTNGTLEGKSASDLYRIEGHPILTNNVHLIVDPSTIPLSPNGTDGT